MFVLTLAISLIGMLPKLSTKSTIFRRTQLCSTSSNKLLSVCLCHDQLCLLRCILFSFSWWDFLFKKLDKILGFRPSFKFYNKWVSLIGAIMNVAMMFLISWQMALVTSSLFGIIWLYLNKRNPGMSSNSYEKFDFFFEQPNLSK
jgi:hypothetical protein